MLICFNSTRIVAINLPQNFIEFIENKGQWEKNVLFKADIPIGNLFIEKDRLTYLFIDKDATHEIQHGKRIDKIHFHSVRVKLIGSNQNPQVLSFEPSIAYYNYFIGEADKHATNVHGFKRVVLGNVYPGIDMELLSMGSSIKINFLVKPGANPNQIAIEYQGADKLAIQNGQLKIITSMGQILEESPVSFQTINGIEKEIKTSYKLEGNTIRFSLKNYNKFLPLAIDPEVVFGTYMGSLADNFGFAASYDGNGNALGAGTVYAANFPITTGAYDVSFANGNSDNNEYARDAFIAKFNPTGSSLIFASFIGGSDNEQPHSVTTVPSSINNLNSDIIIFGTTHSSNFPVTVNGHDKTYAGGYDIFVLKLNANGNTLLASTFLGGINDDGITGVSNGSFSAQPNNLPYNYADWFRGEVIVDLIGNIIISSCTKSSHLQGMPLINAAQPIYGGGNQDGLLVKYNSTLSTILFSTFIGGNNDEAAYSVCVNNLNEIVVGGGTTSTNLGFSSTSFPPLGATDGFIGKYGSNGVRQRIIYAGSTLYDQVFFVATDDQNRIYSMGQTEGNMNLSANTYGITNGKHFVQQYNSDLTNLIKTSTFGKFGATMPTLSPSAFMVDKCGRVYISGWGGGTNQSYHFGLDNLFGFPTSVDAFQKTTDGSDFYLMVLAPNFTNLLYATYYGGSTSQEHVDGGTSHFDPSGVVYQSACAGCGGYSDFPTTPTAYSKINPSKRAFNPSQGGCNLGLFKFDMRTYLLPPNMLDTVLYVKAGSTLDYDFYATDAGGDMLTLSATGDILTKVPNPASISVISSSPGLLWGKLNWKSLCSDLGSDTFRLEVTIQDGACPLPNEKKASIKIILYTDTLSPPFPQCLKAINDSNLVLDWALPNPQTDFGKYILLRSIDGAEMKVYDSIFNPFLQNYTDLNAPNNFEKNYCFQLLTLNTCDIAGDSSRKICSKVVVDSSTQVYFLNLETEIIRLNAFDTLFKQVNIQSLEPLDSVFLKLSGKFIDNKEGVISTSNNLGNATVIVSWVPDCNDINKDTLELLLQVRDNTCPIAKTGFKRLLFLVDPIPQPKSPRVYCPKVVSDDTVTIEWPTYPINKFTKEIYLYREINGVRQKIATLSSLNQITYTDVFKFDETKTTCYSMSSSDICGYHSDTSTSSCIAFQPIPNENLKLYSVSVQNDKEIKLTWQAAAADSFWRYLIYRKEGRNGLGFEKYGEIRSQNDTSFIDAKVNVDQTSYCYKLVNVDVCGNPSINDREACSIVLSGNSIPFVHDLSWLSYDYWMVGTQRYELFRTEPGINANQLIASIHSKQFYSKDDALNYDNGLYQYKVIAFENPNGDAQISESNTIELLQLPIVYAPNAYTENGDGLNDNFQTVPVFVKDYHIQIFNRWGEKIFETKDKYKFFDSRFKEKESQGDVYFYLINYTGWNNLVYTKKGNFTILR